MAQGLCDLTSILPSRLRNFTVQGHFKAGRALQGMNGLHRPLLSHHESRAPVCSPGCRSWPLPNRLRRETSEWAVAPTAAAAAAAAAPAAAVAVVRGEEQIQRQLVQRTVALAPVPSRIPPRTGRGRLEAGLPRPTGYCRNETVVPIQSWYGNQTAGRHGVKRKLKSKLHPSS